MRRETVSQEKNPNPKDEDRSREMSRTSREGSDMSGWRHELQAAKVKFDDDAKQTFLQEYAKSDRLQASAALAGVCLQTVRNHIDNDPDFAEAIKEAKEAYKDRLREHVQDLVFEGVDEPIIGGQFKDEVVAHKRVYPTNLIAMEMKKTDPEYRDKHEHNHNVRGGVLLIPATPETKEDQDALERELADQQGAVIESTAQEVVVEDE